MQGDSLLLRSNRAEVALRCAVRVFPVFFFIHIVNNLMINKGAEQMNVIADITGTVWKVEVSVGQSVAAGETLLIVESMKMEIPVSAQAAGVVKEIFVAEGDLIEDGMTVLQLG
jgi:biotin carboxyl carrier protein